jgi:universal stress protein A
MQVYRHVMVSTDFSDAARSAAQRARRVAADLGARLTLVHVVEYFPEDLPVRVIAPEDRDPQEYLASHARGLLERLAREIDRPDAECVVEFSTHSARHEIPRIAAERGVDLLVVGSHGRRGRGPALGSTASAVINHAACDVLVVQGPG